MSGAEQLSGTLGADLTGVSPIERVTDWSRAKRIGERFGGAWMAKALSLDVGAGRAAKRASEALAPRIETIAITETAEAFSGGRGEALKRVDPASVVDLLKVWDATLDKRTCLRCSDADGTIVFARDSFPIGEPGAVHPRCRCTWQIIGRSELKGKRPPPAPSTISIPETPKLKPLVKAPASKQLTGVRAEKAAFLATGMQGVAVPQSGLRPESFAHLRSGGAVYGGPVTFGIRHDGSRYIIDGRHRLTLARERGDAEIDARVVAYGKRMGVRWEYTGKVKI
jgi:hypothetical protein